MSAQPKDRSPSAADIEAACMELAWLGFENLQFHARQAVPFIAVSDDYSTWVQLHLRGSFPEMYDAKLRATTDAIMLLARLERQLQLEAASRPVSDTSFGHTDGATNAHTLH